VRKISPPVLPIPPVTASIRTRINRLSEHDETVLKVVGRHLGSLASLDLAERIRPGDAHDRHGWADRKRRLTPECSSRWAGSITKASNEAYALARRNQWRTLTDTRRAIRVIEKKAHKPTRDVLGVESIPTAKFRRRLVAMSSHMGIAMVAVDPAYTSKWGGEHWQKPLSTKTRNLSRHEAAAIVIGRRGLRLRARRRGVPFKGRGKPAPDRGHSHKEESGIEAGEGVASPGAENHQSSLADGAGREATHRRTGRRSGGHSADIF
jgi:hypothetical protein